MNMSISFDDDIKDRCIKLVTCECAPNIALIKYWGKSDEDLILPLNSSISITLDCDILKSTTSLALVKRANNSEPQIRIWFDDKIDEFDSNTSDLTVKKVLSRKRFIRILKMVRENFHHEDYLIRIKSLNSFPTACGLASSASGYAALAHCIAHAFDFKGDISELARLGSGSACRSCFGGFVKWNASNQSSLSIAKQLKPSNYWPELNIVVLVLNDHRKENSSTDGMKLTVESSELIKHRVKLVEETRIKVIEDALNDKNFEKFGEIIMRDSNNFHAVCMDTYPPIFYLNESSKEIIQLVHIFNQTGVKVAYSFDAGPNVFLFTLDDYLSQFVSLLKQIYFSYVSSDDFIEQKFISKAKNMVLINTTPIEKYEKFKTDENNRIKYILHSKVGHDPRISLENYH